MEFKQVKDINKLSKHKTYEVLTFNGVMHHTGWLAFDRHSSNWEVDCGMFHQHPDDINMLYILREIKR